MKKRFLIGIFIFLFILSIFLSNSSIAGANPLPAQPTYKLVWDDDFNSLSLNNRWEWIRENASNWSLSERPGFLRIIAQNGYIYGPGGDLENILLTEAPTDDYLLITKLDFAPTQNYEEAGLLIYQDDDNYLYLYRGFADGNMVRFRSEVGGVPETINADVTATSLYLRVRRENNVYFAHYSLDGVTWQFVGSHNADLLSPKLGLAASSEGNLDPINADFDQITLYVNPFNTSWKDEFSSSNLDSHWTWVRELESNWSLTANPGYMRIISNGDLHQTSNNARNVLLMTPPTENFRITTRVLVSPTENYHKASILVYQDDDNYLKLSRTYSDGQVVRLRAEVDGVISTIGSLDVTETDLFLRIIKRGNSYAGYYSLDGQHWEWVGYFYNTFIDPKVGVFVAPGISSTDIVADYDFFEIEYYQNKIYLPVSFKNYSGSGQQSNWVVADSYDGYPQGISMLSEENGWILGSTLDGLLHHWDGDNWTHTHTITHTQSIVRGDVTAVSASDGWAVLGGPLGSDGESRIYRWNESTWDYNTTLTNPSEFSAAALDVVAPDDVWLVAGFAFGSFLYRWNGSTWGLVDTLYLPVTVDDDLDMISASDGWSIGFTGKIAHWDGLDWVEVPSPVTVALNGISIVSSSDGWIVGDAGTILRWENASWVAVTSPTSEDLYDVFMVSADTGWAVGDAGTILKWNGTNWTEQSSPVTSSIRKIHMLSETEGWAITTGGEILHFTPDVP